MRGYDLYKNRFVSSGIKFISNVLTPIFHPGGYASNGQVSKYRHDDVVFPNVLQQLHSVHPAIAIPGQSIWRPDKVWCRVHEC